MESGGVFVGAEVSIIHAPVANGFGDAGHQLTHAGFTLGGSDLAVKVFRGDDIGRGHGPVFGDFDVFLLEDHASLGVGDLSVAEFPLDLGVGGNSGIGEEAAEGEAGGLGLPGGNGGGLGLDLVLDFGHILLLIK